MKNKHDTEPPIQVRPPGCPALVFISHDHDYGYCQEQRHRVSLGVTDACLCDHCTPDPSDQRHISRDVYFHGNDIVGLHSAKQTALEQAIALASTIPCAPKVDSSLPVPAKPKERAPAKPAPRPKPGLLAFV